jgi:dTDP-4-dehydrorhamnose 3,5-epimerase
MNKFIIEKSKVLNLNIITPFSVEDKRGLFLKDFSKEIFEDNGIIHNVQEIFFTKSKKGVVRAIHFQEIKQQAKLVSCLKGEIYDVVVDLRPQSKTYGKWESFELSETNRKLVHIPEFFGHGYLVIKPAIVSYICSEKFYPEYDSGILWNDSNIGVIWPTHKVSEIILSQKDINLGSFHDYDKKMNKEKYHE